MQERRKHSRLEEEDSVFVKVLRAPVAPSLEGQTFFCTTEDLSESGLRFCIPRVVPIGAVLELSVGFTKPRKAFTHTGRVVWIGKDEKKNMTAVGVEFTGTPEAQRVAWSSILASKLGG